MWQRICSGLISIIEKGVKDEHGHAVYKDYCLDCGMDELKARLKYLGCTIEIPHYPEYSNEELAQRGAGINFIAELIDYPPHK